MGNICNQFLDFFVSGKSPLIEHCGEFEFRILLCRFYQFFRKRLMHGDRFFRDDMFLVFQSFDRQRHMEIMRRSHDHGIDIRFFEKRFRIGEKLNLFGIVALQFFRIDVAQSCEFRIGELTDADHMSAAHVAHTDNTDFHLIHFYFLSIVDRSVKNSLSIK